MEYHGENTHNFHEPLDENIEYYEKKNEMLPLRHKHEKKLDEFANHYCIFNPSITGAEIHTVGKYSEYTRIEDTIKSEHYK